MQGDTLVYGLAGSLAIALLVAAFTDLRRRQIDNWLNAGIALAAPLFWWALWLDGRFEPWPDIAWQIGVATLVFVSLAGLFALRLMGGGDVKLLTALALWLPWQPFLKLVVVMALVGGVLTVVFGMWHIARRQKDKVKIPYGIAIASAGVWVILTTYSPQLIFTGQPG